VLEIAVDEAEGARLALERRLDIPHARGREKLRRGEEPAGLFERKDRGGRERSLRANTEGVGTP